MKVAAAAVAAVTWTMRGTPPADAGTHAVDVASSVGVTVLQADRDNELQIVRETCVGTTMDVPTGHALPAGHGPLHAADVPAVAPNVPAGQSVQPGSPASEYLPAGHNVEAESAPVPAGHALPAGHGPLHAAEVRPAVAPNVPAGQGVQESAPASENVPLLQITEAGLIA